MVATKGTPAFARGGRPPGGKPAGPVSSTLGRVELVEAATAPSIRTPDSADVLRAVQDLSKKLQHVSKNQQVIDAKLDRLTARLSAADANVITGVNFLTKVMVSVGWWAAGDTDTAEQVYPANPHWQ